MIAVDIAGVHKSFGDVRALGDVTLSIQEGEFFGLLGPNGAGKTTLLRVLSGVLKADRGQVSILGHPATGKKVSLLLGVVPQDIALYGTLSARGNLELFGSLRGIHGAQLAERVRQALAVVELEEHQHRRVRTFSGGMKRRLNLAVGLLHDPPVLLLDEPTVGVDPQSRAKIFSLLRELHAAGKTIMYTTHYMEEAEKLCERVGIMDHGIVLADGKLGDLLALVKLPRSVRIHYAGENGSPPELEGAKRLAESGYVEYVPASPDKLGAIVAQIERLGLAYDRMEIVGPNLETLFLQLTGKELRD